MVDLKPNLASYARVSYLRELHGDLPGALYAMRLAVSAGGGAPENVAYVQTLLGNLEFDAGARRAARAAYRAGARALPGLRARQAGLASVERGRGRAGRRRSARLRDASRACPCPSTWSSSARPSRRPGAPPPRARDLALVGAEERLLRRNGVNTDVDLALFEANHGSAGARYHAGPARVGAGAQRALGRLPGLGPDSRRPRAGRPPVGATRAAAGLARPDRPLSRRDGGASGRAHGAGRTRCCAGRWPTTRASRRCTRRGRGGAAVRRALLVAGLALALLVPAAAAGAHPLGNFSVNHLVTVRISSDRIDLGYILDQAEIPTFQERGRSRAPRCSRASRRRSRARCASPSTGARSRSCRARRGLSAPPGQGGLPLTRMELPLTAAVHGPHRVQVDDETFPDRVGWKAVVAAPGKGTAVRSSAPSGDPTGGLRHYPKDMLSSPLAERTATFAVPPGTGTLDGAQGRRRRHDDRPLGRRLRRRVRRRGGGQGRVAPAHPRRVRVGRGARALARPRQDHGRRLPRGHARHGPARGRPRRNGDRRAHARRLRAWPGGAAAGPVHPPRAALPMAEPGLGPARARDRRQRAALAPARARARARPPSHHDHHHDEAPSKKTILALGASAGILPCPSALVVLLAALASHQIPLGIGLIVVFSLGLAATLTGLGLLVVYAKRLTGRLRIPAGVTAAGARAVRPGHRRHRRRHDREGPAASRVIQRHV